MSTHGTGERVFNVLNIAILLSVLLCSLYPLYYTFIASISEGSQVVRGKVVFFPVEATARAYELIPAIDHFFTAYGNTLFYTLFGTLTSMVIMTMGAYPLSRRSLKGRRLIGVMISFTMWFHAGLIPFYLNMDSLHLLNTRTGILFGFACSAFYIIILRSYFESLPEELEEAAKVDGMGHFGIFRKIVLPLSTPVLATVGLYCAVDRWNGYFWAMILLKDIRLVPLQVLLKKLIIERNVLATIDSGGAFDFTQETLIYAIVVVAILPILLVYPMAQRYFVKGLTVGSVKG